MKSGREDEDAAVLKMLESRYCPAPIREARERQDAILVERFRGLPLRIADVGCGTGYHGEIFAPSCDLYHGFEISPQIARIARERWRGAGLRNAEVFVGDVAELDLDPDFYDLVFCLYFTPGNFRDPSKDLSLYTASYLDRNPKFITVTSRLHRALRPGGRMLLTVYQDVPEAEQAQIDFYEGTGGEVVSQRGSRFVATADGFWSARWTPKQRAVEPRRVRDRGIESTVPRSRRGRVAGGSGEGAGVGTERTGYRF